MKHILLKSKVWGGVLAALILLLSSNAFATDVSVVNNHSVAITGTLNCSDGGHMVSVDPNSSVQESVGTIYSITINGQTLNMMQNGTVTLPDLSIVDVAWQQNPVTGSVSITVTLDGGKG